MSHKLCKLYTRHARGESARLSAKRPAPRGENGLAKIIMKVSATTRARNPERGTRSLATLIARARVR